MNRIAYMKNRNLADEINRNFPISKKELEAISKVDRELFVPNGFKYHAYKLDALPITARQFISSPLTVAKMTHYLQHEGADSVLEIGCGSGYQAAVLSNLFRRVFTIERIAPLLSEAKERFKRLDIHNIHTRLADGQSGWSTYAPFDRILFSASAQEIPNYIFEQLKEGGILVAPTNDGSSQIIRRFRKNGGRIREECLEACEFVPILSGVEK